VASTSRSKPRRRHRRVKVRWGRLLMVVAVLYIVVSCIGVEVRILAARRNMAELERQIQIEKSRAELLQSEIAYRDTAEYIELVARRELGLIKTGEVPVMMGVSR